MKNEAVVLAGIRPQAFQAAAPPKQHWCDQQQQEEEEEQAASSSSNKTGCGSAGAGELCQWERRRFLFARSTPSIAQTVQICFSLLPFNIQIVLGWIGFFYFLDCRIQILKKPFGF